jgi:hypothetical protein
MVHSLGIQRIIVASISCLALVLLSLVVPSSAWANSSAPTVTRATSQRFANPIAITAHGKYVWVVDNSGGPDQHGLIYRINSSTGQTLPIRNPLIHAPAWVYSDGTNLWIGTQSGDGLIPSLLKLTIATNHVTRVMSKGVNGPVAMTTNGKYLWLLNDNGGSSVTRIDMATGAFTTNNSTETAGENAITSDKTYVWVSGAHLLRISIATNKVKVLDQRHFTDTNEIVSHGANVWFLAGNRHLTEMNAVSDKYRSFYNPAFQFSPAISIDGRNIWMSDDYDRDVLLFHVDTGKVTDVNSPDFSSQTLGLMPYAITSDGSHAWVTVKCNKIVNYKSVACSYVDRLSP